MKLVTFLNQELERRNRKNPSYGLRAFARDLNCDPSLLSKIMTEKRAPSKEISLRVSRLLGWKDSVSKNEYAADKVSYAQLKAEIFEVVSSLIHYTILEMTKLTSFQPSIEWIAKIAGKPTPTIRAAVQRLEDVGLLEKTEDGKWREAEANLSHILGPTKTTRAHKDHQREILQKALSALDEIDIDEREQSSIMMATSAEKLSQARERIRDFRRELCAFLEDTSEKDCVMQLSVSLFPLTRFEKRSANEIR